MKFNVKIQSKNSEALKESWHKNWTYSGQPVFQQNSLRSISVKTN
jgi:hypothetical protein